LIEVVHGSFRWQDLTPADAVYSEIEIDPEGATPRKIDRPSRCYGAASNRLGGRFFLRPD
jgi:hypothetical protein